jgi:hypothetical protein
MIISLLGSKSEEQVLFYLRARKEGYAREIARYYKTNLSPIQKQLDKLETGNLLVSKLIGKTRLYSFNPRNPFLNELCSLLDKEIQSLPQDEREKLVIVRGRPRRKGKPLN